MKDRTLTCIHTWRWEACEWQWWLSLKRKQRNTHIYMETYYSIPAVHRQFQTAFSTETKGKLYSGGCKHLEKPCGGVLSGQSKVSFAWLGRDLSWRAEAQVYVASTWCQVQLVCHFMLLLDDMIMIIVLTNRGDIKALLPINLVLFESVFLPLPLPLFFLSEPAWTQRRLWQEATLQHTVMQCHKTSTNPHRHDAPKLSGDKGAE